MDGAPGVLARGVSKVLGATAASSRLRVPGPTVVLTFDDGPDPVHTPAVLTALAERTATATFFVLMSRATAAPSLLAEVLSEGHELALHGPDHRPLTEFPADETMRRTRDAFAALEDLAQTRVRRFRPPYGLLTPASVRAVRTSGRHILLWNRATLDWTSASTSARVHAATHGARAGDVLLAHDAHATPADGALDGSGPDVDRAELTRLVLEGLGAAGLRGVSAARAAVAY